MATAFSLVSWNVEHFKGKPERLKQVVKFLKAQNPDILGLYEVEGKEVFRELSRTMPNYSFHITEGRQSQEILVGVKSGFTSFFSQRVAFKAGNSWLRPGALLTVTIDEADYSLLFLHLKSKSEPVGLGLRDDQLAKAQKLKKKLDKAQPGAKRANFMVLGDLNTMGMKYIKGKGISGNLELAKLDKDLARKSVAMRRLTKAADASWWNGPGSSYPPGNLDHVLASDHLAFKKFNRLGDDGKAEVDVRGWPALATNAQKVQWINRYSDHGLLYLEAQKV